MRLSERECSTWRRWNLNWENTSSKLIWSAKSQFMSHNSYIRRRENSRIIHKINSLLPFELSTSFLLRVLPLSCFVFNWTLISAVSWCLEELFIYNFHELFSLSCAFLLVTFFLLFSVYDGNCERSPRSSWVKDLKYLWEIKCWIFFLFSLLFASFFSLSFIWTIRNIAEFCDFYHRVFPHRSTSHTHITECAMRAVWVEEKSISIDETMQKNE